MDFSYWFPWKYAGVRFQGTGASISGGGGSQTREVTPVPGFAPVTVTAGGGGGSVAAGIIVADGMLRPLDDFRPNFHLAPYAFAGFGGIFLGSPSNEGSFNETFTVTNSAGVSREVTFKGRVASKIQRDFASDQVLGHVGGGLEYRFTPNARKYG